MSRELRDDHLRLLIDEPRDGAWNMAIDEVLLLSAGREGIATLRFYEWSEPTISLGYFQRHADRATHAASRTCPLVRRASGGGAILHDRELTYSLALPRDHRLARDAESLYRLVHGTLVELLNRDAVAANLWPGDKSRNAAPEPWLCFERRGAGDVVVDGFKVAGSAQRRHGGAILQHGSLLLGTTLFAPELPGLEQIAGRKIPSAKFRDDWLEHLRSGLGGGWNECPLSATETGAVQELRAGKYAGNDWNHRR